jgi:hypothetical protein
LEGSDNVHLGHNIGTRRWSAVSEGRSSLDATQDGAACGCWCSTGHTAVGAMAPSYSYSRRPCAIMRMRADALLDLLFRCEDSSHQTLHGSAVWWGRNWLVTSLRWSSSVCRICGDTRTCGMTRINPFHQCGSFCGSYAGCDQARTVVIPNFNWLNSTKLMWIRY